MNFIKKIFGSNILCFFMGFLLCLALLLIFAYHDPIQILKDWQTLIAGLLALIGALWTVSTIKKQISLQKYQMQNERYEKLSVIKKLLYKPTMDYKTYITQIYLEKTGLIILLEEKKYREDLIMLIDTIEYVDWKLVQFITKIKYYDFRLHKKIEFYNKLSKQHQIEALADVIILKYMIDEFIDFLNSSPLENNLPMIINSKCLIKKFKNDFLFKCIEKDEETKYEIFKKLKPSIIIWTDKDEAKFV